MEFSNMSDEELLERATSEPPLSDAECRAMVVELADRVEDLLEILEMEGVRFFPITIQ